MKITDDQVAYLERLCKRLERPRFSFLQGDYLYIREIIPKVAELQAQRDKAVEAINSVLSGEYDPRKNKNELCKHEKYGWEDCGQCIDEYLVKALKAIQGE